MLPHDVKQLDDTNGFFVTSPVLPENKTQRRLLEQQKLIQTSLDGFLVVAVTNGRIIEANDAFCGMLGYSRQELLGMVLSDLEADESPAEIAAHIKKIMDVGHDRFETRHRHKQGQLIDLEISVSHSELDGGTHFMFARNITERKRAERELQAHARSLECMDRINQAILGTNDLEQMMRDVLDVVLSIFDCDRAFLVYPCDPDAAEWRPQMERTRPEYPGALALGRVVPMDKEVAGLMLILLDTAGPVRFGPGAEFPLPLNVSAQFGIQSQMLMALHPKLDQPWQFGIHQCAHARDWAADDAVLFQKIGWRLSDALTSLLMYRNLQASEQKFRTLAENMPDNIVRYDGKRVTVYVNPVLERTLGDIAAKMIGTTPREYHPDGSYEDYARMLDTVLASGEAGELEKILPGPGGKTSVHQIRAIPERDENGEVVGALVIGRDITELKQAEHQLRKLTAHLQTIREEEKAHLAREIHDELGSILLALRIETHLLNSGLSADQKKTPLFERVESMVDLLEDAMKSTRNIINDLRPTVLDDLGLMAALEWQAAQFHKHTGIECRVACLFREANGCTDCKGCEYTADKTLSINLFRIFQEALNNVARHSGASRVDVELQPGDREVALSISDNGRGLPRRHTIAPTSYGIRGMRERVQHLSGKIEFGEAPGGGLGVLVRVPLQNQRS